MLWGRNPVYIERGTWPYFLIRAKEAGVPFIVIDPRYCASAETLNGQWIPIRPGTDLAMALAVANVLIKENLYDKEYVAKWAEPTGFAKFKDYLLGSEDGTEKSPEWAEKLCGVPAETIRELARLYAHSRPAMMLFGWASCRSMSTNVSRVIIYLSCANRQSNRTRRRTSILGRIHQEPSCQCDPLHRASIGNRHGQFPSYSMGQPSMRTPFCSERRLIRESSNPKNTTELSVTSATVR